MITINELIGKSNQEKMSNIVSNHRFILMPESDQGKEIAALFAYFASHEDNTTIVIYKGEKKIGYIDRDTVLHSISILEKDMGTGDYPFLHGDPAKYYVVYKCPKKGCEEKKYLSYYDPDAEIYCPVHKHIRMKREL